MKRRREEDVLSLVLPIARAASSATSTSALSFELLESGFSDLDGRGLAKGWWCGDRNDHVVITCAKSSSSIVCCLVEGWWLKSGRNAQRGAISASSRDFVVVQILDGF